MVRPHSIAKKKKKGSTADGSDPNLACPSRPASVLRGGGMSRTTAVKADQCDHRCNIEATNGWVAGDRQLAPLLSLALHGRLCRAPGHEQWKAGGCDTRGLCNVGREREREGLLGTFGRARDSLPTTQLSAYFITAAWRTRHHGKQRRHAALCNPLPQALRLPFWVKERLYTLIPLRFVHLKEHITDRDAYLDESQSTWSGEISDSVLG